MNDEEQLNVITGVVTILVAHMSSKDETLPNLHPKYKGSAAGALKVWLLMYAAKHGSLKFQLDEEGNPLLDARGWPLMEEGTETAEEIFNRMLSEGRVS